jgi:hypothetical protein
MTVTIPFEPGYTWRKLGYLYFTNSLAYRDVIEQNPQWDVTELPPVGAALRISNGGENNVEGSSFLTGVDNFSVQDIIFPYQNTSEYLEAISRYTTQTVIEVNRLNGFSQDDLAVYTGNQFDIG